jgi:hypothetical protein
MIAGRSNKELKLTKPSVLELRSLSLVFGDLMRVRSARRLDKA